jgi:hypothetical protein
VRPRLTDKQAYLLQLLIERELACGGQGDGPRLEVVMLGRAQKAIDAAFEAREERRQRRLGAELAWRAERRAVRLGLRRGRPTGAGRWARWRAS